MKIMWLSNAPWAGTGYGEQTALFTPMLAGLGHDVALLANWGIGGGGTEWNGLRLYPSDDRWGNRDLEAFAAHHGGGEPCQVITLCDVFVLDPERMPKPVASWVPVDHEPAPPAVIDYFRRSGATPIAMSRFGEAELARRGFDPLYVPHGVDTTVFRPRSDRLDIREQMGLPRDAFVVGVVAANKGVHVSRKALPQIYQAFARFREDRRDAVLYVHSDLGGGEASHPGIHLRALQEACGIPARAVVYTDQISYRLGCSRESLAAIYSTFDVFANPSFGEGFGIPIVEAQACGVPVIVTDHSAMSELVGPGWLVDGDPWYDGAQGSFYKCPAVGEIQEALDAAYQEAAGKREAARAFAGDYEASLVLEEHWAPALEALGAAQNESRDLEAVAC